MQSTKQSHASVDAAASGPTRNGAANRLIDIASYGAVFLIPFFAYAGNILHSFYLKGSSLYDTGFFAYMLHDGGFSMANPPAIGGSFLALHISPLFVLTTAISHLLPLDPRQFYAAFVGVSHALTGLAVFWLLLAGYRMTTPAQRLAAALLALAFAFDGLALAIAKFPNLPMFFVGCAAMFLAGLALRRVAVALPFFVLSLITREDAGLHLFALLSLALALQWWRGVDQSERRRLAAFAIAALLYSAGAIIVESRMPHEQSLLVAVYLGQPAFAHVTAGSLAALLQGWFAYRAYVVLPAILAFVWAIARRNPQACLGYVAFIPWALLNLTAVRPLVSTLASYYAFPFVLSGLWPLVGLLMQARGESHAVRRDAIWGFALLTAASFMPSPLPHNPTKMRLPADFFAPPSLTRQAATDGALAQVANAPELGTQVVDESVAALVPQLYRPENILAEPQQAPRPDSVIFFADGFQHEQARQIAAAAGLNQLYAFPGTAIRIATRRPISGIEGLVLLPQPATRPAD